MGKAQIQGSATQAAAQLAAMHHMARNAVGPTQQTGSARHIARCQRLPHRRAGHPERSNFITTHARHVKTPLLAQLVQQRIVAQAARAKAKVVAHQHISRAQALLQNFADKGFGRHCRELGVKRQHHALVNAATRQFGQLVAQCGDAGRSQGGFADQLCKIVARVRLESQHAAGQSPVTCFALQQGQHRLVAPVDAIEIANRQGRARCQPGVLKAPENFHRQIIGLFFHKKITKSPRMSACQHLPVY